VGTKFLDREARSAFKRAVEAVENASAVEVVVAVRQTSGTYRHANAIVGAIVAFIGLAVMLYGEQEFALRSILIEPFVVGGLSAWIVELLPMLKRVMTPASRRQFQVDRAARALFVDHNIHITTGRSGILVYISWLEQRVSLVADIGLLRALPENVLPGAQAELTAAVSRGGAAVAKLVEALAPTMAKAMPHRDDDVNELPDAVDSDMGDD